LIVGFLRKNKLSNADFRKLLMTPRSTPASSSHSSAGLGSVHGHHGPGSHVHQRIDISSKESKAESRKKKKQLR
jgi:hypothetical protein